MFLESVTSSDIFHLLFLLPSHHYKAWEVVIMVMNVNKSFGLHNGVLRLSAVCAELATPSTPRVHLL